MKNKNKFNGNQYVPSNKEKRKMLFIFAFVIYILGGIAYSQYSVLYGDYAHAETVDATVTVEDRLGEVLDPKGTIYIKEGVDPAWGVLKTPKKVFARLTGYAKGDSCHYPAPKGGCYTSNWPHIAQEGDMACPLEYEYGTRVYRPKTDTWYICNDRTADWVQEKWSKTPTFDIWSDTAKGVQPKVEEEIIVYPTNRN